MMKVNYSILIPNYHGEEAVELCIESILKRTKALNYKIIIFDSTGEDTKDRKYLRRQEKDGNIELLTYDNHIGHGEALVKLLRHCNTEFAVLLDSDCEIMTSTWISDLTDYIKSDKDLGAGVFRPGAYHVNQKGGWWKTPSFCPHTFLLKLSLYQKIWGDADWLEQRCNYEDYKYKNIFENRKYKIDGIPIINPIVPGLVNAVEVVHDTGGKFTEKVLFENDLRLHVAVIPFELMQTKARHYGGISTNYGRAEHPRVKEKWKTIKSHLSNLRNES